MQRLSQLTSRYTPGFEDPATASHFGRRLFLKVPIQL